MSFLDRKTVYITLTILLFAAVLALAYFARAVLLIFCFSILFAYLINPVVTFLQRHSLFFKNLRGPHVAEAYFALLIIAALLMHALAPGSVGRAVRLVRELPTFSDKLATGEIAMEIGHDNGWSDDQTLRAKSFLVQHRATIQSFTERILQSISKSLGAVLLIPVLAIFFLSDGRRLADQVILRVGGKSNYQSVQSLADELHRMLQHYIRAKVTLGVLSLSYVSLALLILRVPHAVALGILAGALEFIPMAGWMIAAATIVGVGVLTHSHWIVIAALLGIWRILMDYWIAPRVFGHELELHPLVAIFTLMVGATVGGLAGAYLSLPVAAVIRVMWARLDRSTAEHIAGEPASSLAASLKTHSYAQ
jgi:predicted PurR-regulated permease PerM